MLAAGAHFVELLLALGQLVLRNGYLGVDLGPARFIKAHFLRHYIGRFPQQLGWRVESGAARQRLQPQCFGLHRELAGAALQHVGDETGGVHTQQQLARFHDLAFAHRQGLDHAAVHTLDDLHLAGRHHTRLAAGDLVDFGKTGPDQQQQQRAGSQAQQASGAQGLLLQTRPVGVSSPIKPLLLTRRRQPLDQRAERGLAGAGATADQGAGLLEGFFL